jgi:predicted MFS family arabinose efflux permease
LRAILKLYRDAFSGLPGSVWRISFAALVNRAGTMVLPFLSLYLVKVREFSAQQVGLILLFYGLGSVAGSWLGGRAADRFGGVPVQIGSLVASGAGFFVLGSLDSFWPLLICIFTVSAIGDAFRPACMVSIAHRTGEENQVRGFALIRLALNIGMAIGPAAGGVLAILNYRWLFFAEGGTCILAGLLLAVTVRDRTERDDAKERRGRVRAGSPAWRDSRFMVFLAVVFLYAAGLFQVFSTVPLYLAADYGLAEDAIGLMLGFNAVLIVVFEMILVHILANRDKALVIGFGALLTCCGLAIMGLGNTLAWGLFTVVIWSFGEMLVLPFASSEVSTLAGRDRKGEYMGWYTAVFSLAFVVGPPIGLKILDSYGGPVLMALVGLVGPVCWIGCWYLSRATAAATR